MSADQGCHWCTSKASKTLSMLSVVQVGRENPSELKAAKLARSMARGVEDRDLKPNTQERQQIEAVIVGPPNRHADWPCFLDALTFYIVTPLVSCNVYERVMTLFRAEVSPLGLACG